MSSVSHKNPKAPWEENLLWESAESDQTEAALARQVGRGSPPPPPRASRARGMCPSSSAPSTRSQASGQARGNGQATITALFFQLKPNPRVHFCHPARDRSATARRSVGASGEELSSRGDGRAAGKREARSSEDEISWVR